MLVLLINHTDSESQRTSGLSLGVLHPHLKTVFSWVIGCKGWVLSRSKKKTRQKSKAKKIKASKSKKMLVMILTVPNLLINWVYYLNPSPFWRGDDDGGNMESDGQWNHESSRRRKRRRNRRGDDVRRYQGAGEKGRGLRNKFSWSEGNYNYFLTNFKPICQEAYLPLHFWRGLGWS